MDQHWPPHISYRPLLTTHWALTDNHGPQWTVTNHSVNTTHHPLTSHWPPRISQWSPITDNHKPVTDHRWPVTERHWKLTITDIHWPPFTIQWPPLTSHWPPLSSHWPLSTHWPPHTTHYLWPVIDHSQIINWLLTGYLMITLHPMTTQQCPLTTILTTHWPSTEQTLSTQWRPLITH